MDVKEYENHIRVLEGKIQFLEHENSQLRVISENSTDMISIHASDTTFLYTSPSSSSLLGYTPEEMTGHTPYDFLYPDDLTQFRIFHQKILTGKQTTTWSYQVRRKDGKYIWVETTSKCIGTDVPDDQLEIIAITREITSRKITELTLAIRESELKEKEELFRNLIQNISDLIVVVNAEGMLTYVSPSISQVLGYRPDDIILKAAVTFIHPDDVAALSAEFGLFLRNVQSIVRMEFRARHKNGNWIYIEVTGNNLINIPFIGGIVFTARDITLRKQQVQLLERYQQKLEFLVKERTEELAQMNEELAVTNEELTATNEELYKANLELDRTNKSISEEIDKRKLIQDLLEESENKFRSFIVQSYEGIVLINEQGQIVEWNQAITKILEIPRGQVISQYVWDIDFKFSPQTGKMPQTYKRIVTQAKAYIANIFKTMEVKRIEGWQYFVPDKHRFLQMTIFPFETRNGKFMGITINDITEKKQTEEELASYQNQLEELVKSRTDELLKKEELIRIIENSISFTFGETFFENIVLNISKVVKADVVLVGELADSMDIVDTISICENGRIIKNIKFPLTGTPCNNLIGKKICIFRDHLSTDYPHDKIIKKFNIEAYIGVPLFDSKGLPVGLMAAMFKAPILESEPIGVSILQIFASRVGVEIERKRIENNLRTSEEKFRNVVENIPMGIAISTFDNEFIYANNKLIELFGYSADEVQTEEEWNKRGYPDPEYRALTNKQWKEDVKAVLSGKLARAPIREHRICCSDGSFKDVEVSFSIYGNMLFSIFNDITQRKQAEQKLIDNEQKISNIFNSITDAIIISDKNRKILQVNNSVASIMKYTLDEFLSIPAFSYIAPAYRSLLDERLQLLLQGIAPGIIELEVIKKDGSLLPVEFNSQPIYHEGKPAILTIARDISERKVTEKRLFETIIRTEEKEREKFAANLHDEVGPILSSLKMYLSSLAESDDNTKKDHILPIVQNLIVEAIATVRDISNDLSPLLLNKQGLEKALSAYLQFKYELIEIKFDQNIEGMRFNPNVEVVFYRIVKELLNNTIKHANASRVNLSIFHENDVLKLTYIDDGSGFELDSLLDNTASGMGLMNIISRAKTINSKYQISTSINNGFKFELSAPWQ